jgi:hypothetical protein
MLELPTEVVFVFSLGDAGSRKRKQIVGSLSDSSLCKACAVQ